MQNTRTNHTEKRCTWFTPNSGLRPPNGLDFIKSFNQGYKTAVVIQHPFHENPSLL